MDQWPGNILAGLGTCQYGLGTYWLAEDFPGWLRDMPGCLKDILAVWRHARQAQGHGDGREAMPSCHGDTSCWHKDTPGWHWDVPSCPQCPTLEARFSTRATIEFLKSVPVVSGRLVTSVMLCSPSGHMARSTGSALGTALAWGRWHWAPCSRFTAVLPVPQLCPQPVVEEPFEVLEECVLVLVQETFHRVSEEEDITVRDSSSHPGDVPGSTHGAQGTLGFSGHGYRVPLTLSPGCGVSYTAHPAVDGL